MSTNQNLKNKFKIYELVKNHFDLTKKSLDLFKYRLFYEPHIAPEYAKILKEFASPEDPLRAKIPLNNSDFLSKIDKGWTSFKDYFYAFTEKYFVTYENFKENKIIINKQSLKLMKAVLLFYEKEYNNDKNSFYYSYYNPAGIKRKIEYIGTQKLSNKKNLSIVLSLNFADWFLSSTQESWTSCLNLESDYECAFWAGLPGLIGDKNRALLYITDGKRKEYLGIETDRFISRSWTLTMRQLVSKNINKTLISTVHEYPCNLNIYKIAQELIDPNFVNNEFIFSSEKNNFVSRYYLENLFHTYKGNDITCFIYQDTTKNLIGKKNKAKIEFGRYSYLKAGSDLTRYNSNGIELSVDPFYYTGGLKNLVSMKSIITDENIENNCYSCYSCNTRINEESILWASNNSYCEYCYSDIFVNCYVCGDPVEHKETNETKDGELICEYCADKKYFFCSDCDKFVSLEQMVVVINTESHICQCCKENTKYFFCDECGNTFEINNETNCIEESNQTFCSEECQMAFKEKYKSSTSQNRIASFNCIRS